MMLGCAHSSDDSPEPILSQQNRTMRLGQSLQGRPIDMHVFERGSATVLIIGGIHGSERASVDVAQGLLRLLQQSSPSQGATVAIIPIANPDGYAARSRGNANRVDVNRNFPAKNWRQAKSRSTTSGPAPLSEPESRAILHAIQTLKPNLIISIHSIGDGKQCNNYDGPAQHIAHLMSRHNGYPVTATMGYPTPGSLGSFAGIDQQIPIITLELPRELSGGQAWEQNRDAILSAIAGTIRQ